ncbi:MAG: hypothetical protein JXQ73_12815 [Phycisphaerae bacterium]|nr:hypothetical protein [Phycisphaerae bacterium]
MHFVFTSVLGLTCLATFAAGAETATGDALGRRPTVERGLIHNEDCSHFFITRDPDTLDMKELHAFIDQYAGTQLTHFFMNPNAMRTSFRSKVWDNIWRSGDPAPGIANGLFPGAARNWALNTYRLDKKGIDPYAVWIERCRKWGISPWISMRMNDCHENDNVKSYLHSTFWVKHPEYWRGGTGYFARCFNFGIKEVYDYHMALVREYLERYDLDGLELDWMRECFCFKPGEEAKGRGVLTDFMKETRRLANERGAKRGRPIKIAARVPAAPEASIGMGLDGVGWAKEGLVDMLIPTARWATADFDIPIDQWRKLLGDAAKRVMLAAGMEIRIQPYPGATAIMSTRETLRGFSAAMLERGADQVYLFNHMDRDPSVPSEEYLAQFREAGRLETVVDKPRRHVVTYRDISPPEKPFPSALPAGVKAGSPARFSIYIGPQPKSGKVVVRVGLAQGTGVGEAQLAARVNDAECKVIADHAKPGEFCGAIRVAQFDVPLSAVRGGYNQIEVVLVKGEPQRIVWMETYIVP